MTARVFISYRRSDSKAVTDRLAEHLNERLGEDNVFRDVESIDPGKDYTVALAEGLDQCRTALVLIGGSWFEAADENGARRLEDPEDWVRKEILAVLERDIQVIPVLLDDTKMPSEDDFPPALRPLARRQAVKLRADPDFANDVKRLLLHVPGANPPVLYWNLALVVLLFALCAFWAQRYSNWSGSVLAATAGGCLALFGVLFKVLPDHRIRAIKGWIEERLFLNPRATVALGLLFVLATVGFSFSGSVCIVTPADSPSRSVAISASEDPEQYSVLDPGVWRKVFWTLPWSPRRLTVFVEDLPELPVELSSWERKTLTVPTDFFRPAVLVYCDSLVLAETAKQPPTGRVFRCSITLAGEQLEEFVYEGQSFYVGCRQKAGLPATVQSAWTDDLANRDLTEGDKEILLTHWKTLGAGLDTAPLKAGDTLVVEIRNYAGSAFEAVGRAETVVEDLAQSGAFPQTLPLRIL